MRRKHFFSGLLAVAVLFAGPLYLHAADDVTEQIPDGALAYVVVKNLQEASREIDQTAQKMQLSVPNLLKMARQRLGSLKGVVETGDLALVLVGSEAGSPSPVIFVRTNDYDTLLRQLNPDDQNGPISQVAVAGQSVLIAKKGNYAVLTQPAHRDGLKHVVESDKSVQLDDAAHAFTRSADVYAVATNSGVKTLSQQALVGLQAVKQQFAEMGPEMKPAIAAFGMYEEMFQWAAKEVEQVVVTLRIDESGAISVVKRVGFTNPVEYTTASSAASATKRLAQLPKWPYVMTFAGEIGNSKAIEKWMELSMDMMRAMAGPQQLTGEQTQKLVEASRKSMEGLRGMSFTFGVPETGGSIYSRMGMVMEVQDAKAFIDNYVQAMQQMKEVFADNQAMPYQILTVDKAQVAGKPGMKVVMQIKPAAFGASGEQVKEMFDKLYGKDGKIEVFAAAVDAQHVALVYVDEKNLQELIRVAKSPREGLAADDGIQTTARLLPGKAQLVGYLSPEGMLLYAQRMMQMFVPFEQQAQMPHIPPFPSSPPLGFSFQYDGAALEAGLVAPAELLTALGKYIQAVQQAAP